MSDRIPPGPGFEAPDDDQELEPGPGLYVYDVIADHHPTDEHPDVYVEVATRRVSVIDDDGEEYHITLDDGKLTILHRAIRTSDRMFVLPEVTNRITIDTIGPQR